jgi:hypothetical protein
LTDGDRRRADGYEALELVIGGRKLRFPAVWLRALDAVLRWGFVLLRDVPTEPGMVLEVAASFGFLRETRRALRGAACRAVTRT